MYQSRNPFNRTVEKKFRTISDRILQKKLELSMQAFAYWREQSFKLRGNILNKVATLLEEGKTHYGSLITLEMGKPISQSVAEVEKCAWVCRYYAENAVEFLRNQHIESTAQLSEVVFEPLGTIFGIMPWNYPFWQIFRFIAPTLMAGNIVLFKHASNVPQCAQAIEKLFRDAGASNGVIQNLFINYNQIEKVIANSAIKAVTLTGSNIAGKKVAELAARYTKKTVLELGGSDPFIVFDDADLYLALEAAIMSRFLNSGQSCIAAKRFIVQENIAIEFLNNFQSLVENLILGNPMDEDTFIGPLVNTNALKELQRQVDKSIKLGAICITGGQKNSEMSSIFNPTLLINITPNMPVWNEEVFGPVAVIKTFETNDEAIALANDTQFGLGASVWTQDMDNAAWFSKNLNSGTVCINGMVKSEPALPFGGINSSGYGRELGHYGITEFVNIKTVSDFS